jgi:Fe-S cluster biogenesis protein NfuA
MFIQTEETPNPATLKFLPGCDVLPGGTAEYKSFESATSSPLAMRLLRIEGIKGVFFGSDFITITKDDAKEWIILKPSILGVIMEHFAAKRPVMSAPAQSAHSNAEKDFGNDAEIVNQIRELLDTRVRPAVAQDGGDITFHDFADGVVYLEMRGACAGCPSSTITLKNGIENMLRHYIPEVEEVRAV